MLRIQCPWCGLRDEIEFRCGGQSHVVRPGPPEQVSDATWGQYLSEKINPRGVHFERWVHSSGCQQWFNVARDTATHKISAVYSMGESAPSLDAGGVTL